MNFKGNKFHLSPDDALRQLCISFWVRLGDYSLILGLGVHLTENVNSIYQMLLLQGLDAISSKYSFLLSFCVKILIHNNKKDETERSNELKAKWQEIYTQSKIGTLL